jgi:ABC-type transporter MlaC component
MVGPAGVVVRARPRFGGTALALAAVLAGCELEQSATDPAGEVALDVEAVERPSSPADGTALSASTVVLPPEGHVTPDTEAQLRAIAELRLDVPAMAEWSFREYWGNASDAQRAECVRLLGEVLDRSMVANARRRPRSIEHVVTEDGERGPRVHVIERSLRSRTERVERVTYTLRAVDGEWRVVDQQGEGLGALSEWYATMFAAPSQHDDIVGLIELMRRWLRDGLQAIFDQRRERAASRPDFLGPNAGTGSHVGELRIHVPAASAAGPSQSATD